MRLAQFAPPVIAIVIGTILAAVAATMAANVVERRTLGDVSRILDLNGFDWVNVQTDGLQVILTGSAPDEATRFRALGAAGTVVDASRVADMMDVTVPDPVKPPRFSIEILRNDDGISLIGLVPASMDRETVVETVREIAGTGDVTDLLDVADFPAPEGWENALSFGLQALADLRRSKISIAADAVEIKAISDSRNEKRRLETDLARAAPETLKVAIDISAPRPVIAPYTLRFLIDEDGARFDACSTDTEEGAARIIAAAREAGLEGKTSCTIGLGIPSPDWDDAVISAILRLKELGSGSITFSDADITLVANDTTAQSVFDRIVGELEAELPDVFSLHAVLPEPAKNDGTGTNVGTPEFVATLSPEGLAHLRGRVPDQRARVAAESLARAQFGSKSVNGALRLDPDLPAGWSTRVLAALQALSLLSSGSVVTQPGIVEIRGLTGNPDAKAEIARLLSEKLGEREDFRISVQYQEKLDPLANIPTPEECVAQINEVLAEKQITFAPSSTDIDADARASIERIADIMKLCTDVPMEVGGHTDSQGREVMNQALSQGRAEAVVNALLARRVLTTNLTAVGYGEAQPIADNDTEEGREKNRRIEFRLIEPLRAEPADDSIPSDAAADIGTEPDPAAAGEAQTPNGEAEDEQN